MVECDFCDNEFSSKRKLYTHWGKQHSDELNSHQKQKVKKAKRNQRQEKQQKRQNLKNNFYIGLGLLALISLATGVYIYLPEGPAFNQGIDHGSVGSAHYHADFAVYANGEKIDFSQPKYRVKARFVHVEGGNGDIVHAHATGTTFKQFLNTLGFNYNQTRFKTPGKTYQGEVRMFLDQGEGWKEIEPKPLKFKDGDRILLTYGNYTSKEIGKMQKRVTNQTPLQ